MKWALNDLKVNKDIWSGVLLVLVVTQTILCSMGVSMGINSYYMGISDETRDPAKHLASGLSLVYGTAIILGCLVIMQTLQASIRQRRQELALLSLLGATPRQVLLFTMLQVVVLTLLASLVGLVLSPVLAPRILDFHSSGMKMPMPFVFTWHNFLRSALMSLATGIVVALLATRLTLRELEKTVPVQTLGRAHGDEVLINDKHSRGKALFVAALIVLLIPLSTSLYLAHRNPQTMSREQIIGVFSTTSSGPLLAIILLLIALSRAGGSVIGWVTRLWTNLVPSPSAVWKIARSQAVVRSRGKAFGSTIVSLTSCLFLVGGLLAAGQTSATSIQKIPGLENMSSGGPLEILSGFWAALLIALIGAVASFAISAKERNLDLALISIAGASPEQLLLISALDGFILMMTGILLAAGATFVVGAATAVAYLPLSKSFSVIFPWSLFIALGVPILAIGSIATFVMAHATLKQPAIATIQASIGE
ncbi:FtsX-like permease family protein [Bombiscardovia coagulans]|uniref:FtsX-like permease family n=1 Tax=Bombiscardovia coagulans TaxID=686666 RepID=A0A261EQX0_9BIFI|nr:ABC transporter permease [Bombiscardovia coagulans]OZG49253.1 FtsX-like permease family [Bombiscardovia coagulans]